MRRRAGSWCWCFRRPLMVDAFEDLLCDSCMRRYGVSMFGLHMCALCFPVGAIGIVLMITMLEACAAQLVKGQCPWRCATKHFVQHQVDLVSIAPLVAVTLTQLPFC